MVNPYLFCVQASLISLRLVGKLDLSGVFVVFLCFWKLFQFGES